MFLVQSVFRSFYIFVLWMGNKFEWLQIRRKMNTISVKKKKKKENARIDVVCDAPATGIASTSA